MLGPGSGRPLRMRLSTSAGVAKRNRSQSFAISLRNSADAERMDARIGIGRVADVMVIHEQQSRLFCTGHRAANSAAIGEPNSFLESIRLH